MAKTIGTDVETFRRAVVGELISKGILPRVNVLSDAELAAAAEGDPDAIRKLKLSLLRRNLAMQDIDPGVIARNSFGHKQQLDEAKQAAKLTGLERIEIHVEGELRALPDTELLGLVSMLGLLPADTDSSRTVPRNSASPLMLPDAIGSVRQPEDEHR